MMKQLHAKTDRVFHSIRFHADDPKFALEGRTAEVLKVVERLYDPDDGRKNFALEMHVRNPCGEYFFVIARSSGETFDKHMGQRAARAVLKDRYIPTG